MVSARSGAYSANRAAATAGVRLLRADLMPVLAAILGTRFGERRTIPYAEFVLMVADDLDELRASGVNAPRAAQEYVTDWVRDGYLVRRPTAAREETIEVSRSAADAVRFVLGVAVRPDGRGDLHRASRARRDRAGPVPRRDRIPDR